VGGDERESNEWEEVREWSISGRRGGEEGMV
jgi:hypothetical protein